MKLAKTGEIMAHTHTHRVINRNRHAGTQKLDLLEKDFT